MKKMMLLMSLLAALASPILAQPPVDKMQTSITFDGVGDSARVAGNGYGTVGFQITGTWVGTVHFSGTVDGSNWVGLQGYNAASHAGDSTTTANGLFVVNTSGSRFVKAKMTAWTSGSATVTAISTDDIAVLISSASAGGGGEVTNAGTFAVQAGQAAHDAAIAGNPVRTGLRAVTAHPTAVATGDQVDHLGTIEGKAVVQPYAVRGETWIYAAASGGITDATAVTVKTAAGAGVRNCVTSIQVMNGHATVSTEVLLLDGAAGTVIWRGFAQAAGGGAAAEFLVPLCGTANTLLEVDNGTTGSAVYYNLQGFESQE